MIYKSLLLKFKIKSLFKNVITSSAIYSRPSSTSLIAFDSKKFQRTHYCGSLGLQNKGEHVKLCGWLQSIRSKNFILLRDIQGIVQVHLDDDLLKLNGLEFDQLREESVVAVAGEVLARPTGQQNSKMATGQIEIKCKTIRLLNQSKPVLPFTITDLNRPSEQVRLKYRFLDLRFKEMQHNISLRSNFVHKVRKFMEENRFLDIETPTLFR